MEGRSNWEESRRCFQLYQEQEEAKTFQLRQPIDPVLFTTLPPELHGTILNYLLNTAGDTSDDFWGTGPKASKFRLSRIALACREWYRILRQILFADLWVGSTADVRYLLGALHRPGNEWLLETIKVLRIGGVRDNPQTASVYHSCHLLAGQLPSLQRVNVIFPEEYAVLEPSLQLFLRCNKSIQELRLSNAKFPNLSALVNRLGGMANLKSLMLKDCVLVNSDERRPPTRTPPSRFAGLRRVHCYEKLLSPDICWLFAPLLARRCHVHPPNAMTNNVDAALLLLLHHAVLDSEAIGKQWEIIHDEDSDTVYINNFRSLKLMPEWSIKLRSKALLSQNGKWSTMRSIRYYHRSKATLDKINWLSVDAAVRLKHFSIISCEGPPLPSQLPELRARWRTVRVKDEKSDEESNEESDGETF